MEDTEDATAQAYATIAAQLQGWTSPNLNKMQRSPSYPRDAVAWMQEETNVATAATSRTTPPSAPEQQQQQQQGTPVRDNSTKKKALLVEPLHLSTSKQTLFTTATREAHQYRRYHDVLQTYVDALFQQPRASTEQGEQHYLAALGAAAEALSYDQEESKEYQKQDNKAWLESNVWHLCLALRRQSLDALLWEEPPPDDKVVVETTLTQQTPARRVQQLYESSPRLQRRRIIRKWLQRCHTKRPLLLRASSAGNSSFKKRRNMWPDSLQHLQRQTSSLPHQKKDNNKMQRLDPDAPLLVSTTTSSTKALYGTDGDKEEQLLQSCLSYILMGRLDQALMLLQDYGQPWRCAAWSGGAWQGLDTKGEFMKGNAHRALWKRTCWSLADTNNKISGTETAIYAILSNHVQQALAHPSLRSWESALYACVDASLQRAEDECVWNSGNTKETGSFGTPEQDHLMATAATPLLCKNEATLLDTLASSPFGQLHVRDAYRGCMASILVGHQALLQYVLHEAGGSHHHHQGDDENEASLLRFWTHLVLYLDSLSHSNARVPWSPEVLQTKKHALVLRYLQHLSVRPDLSRLLTLYASLLPTDQMLQVFPKMLANITDNGERAHIVPQLQAHFSAGVDVQVLRRVVALLCHDDGDPVRQATSVTWLCHDPDHAVAALESTNALLRRWLLRDDVSSALEFWTNHVPSAVVGAAATSSSDEEEDPRNQGQRASARLEFGALGCYLEAHQAFLDWKDVMEQTEPTTTTTSYKNSLGSAAEQEIAQSMERRDFLKQKRQTSRHVVEAADVARDKLKRVLQYDGGWLLLDDDDDKMEVEDVIDKQDPDERKRQLKTLSSRYLCSTTFLLHNVCDETATWMEKSLEDAAPVLGKDALSTLDTSMESETSSSSPMSPLYWIRHALSLAEMVASEENKIYEAFGEQDRHHFMSLMAETAVRELEQSQ